VWSGPYEEQLSRLILFCVQKKLLKEGVGAVQKSWLAGVDGVNCLFQYESYGLLNKANGVTSWNKAKEFFFQ